LFLFSPALPFFVFLIRGIIYLLQSVFGQLEPLCPIY
jgi:hypothetical protein